VIKKCNTCKKLTRGSILRRQYFEKIIKGPHEDKVVYIKRKKAYQERKRRYRVFMFDRLKELSIFAFSIGLILQPVEYVQALPFEPNSFFSELWPDQQIRKNMIIKKSYDGLLESVVFRSTKAKDLALLSRRKYEKFVKIADFCASTSYEVRKIQEKIHKLFKVEKNNKGFYCDPRAKIEHVLKKTYEKMKRDGQEIKDNTFILKFAGDGTNITRSKMQIMNFAFTVINDTKTAMSVNGNYSLGKNLILSILKILI